MYVCIYIIFFGFIFSHRVNNIFQSYHFSRPFCMIIIIFFMLCNKLVTVDKIIMIFIFNIFFFSCKSKKEKKREKDLEWWENSSICHNFFFHEKYHQDFHDAQVYFLLSSYVHPCKLWRLYFIVILLSILFIVHFSLSFYERPCDVVQAVVWWL